MKPAALLILPAALVFAAGCGESEPERAKTTRSAPAAVETGEAEIVPQTTCPVMGSPVNRNLYVDHNGKRVYLCCGHCVGAFKADPEKYMQVLAEQGVTLEDAPTAGN